MADRPGEPDARVTVSVGDEPTVTAGFADAAAATRYVLLEELGRGGMGVVRAAHDRQLGRKVAIKLVRPDQPGDTARARLVQEAQALARLQHPNVVTVYDVGTIGDEVFIAMELVAGDSLAAWLARRDRRDWRAIVRPYIAAARGLAAAHDAGLVHRDFKPDNVLIDRDGTVRIADFGLAHLASAPSAESEAPATVVGTPGFMAPEVLRRGRADARSDQFAFAVALCEALSGRPPFAGANHEDVLLAMERPDPIDTGAAPGWLRAVIVRGLAIDPARRFPSMHAVIDALARDPARRRARLLLAAGTVAAVAAVLLVNGLRDASTPCAAAGTARDWTEADRRAVAAAFTATGRPFAADATRAAGQLLDRYAATLDAAEHAACLANVHHEQTAELANLRAACLARRRGELASLVALFRDADAIVVERAVHAAEDLTPIAGCEDAAALLGPARPPSDPALASAVAGLRERVTRARSLYEVGHYREALPIVTAAAAEARATGFRPVEAEAVYALGYTQEAAGEPKAAEVSFRDAIVAATAGGDDEIVVRAASALGANVGRLQERPDEGWSWAQLALAACARLGNPPDLEARSRMILAILARARGRLENASTYARRALAIYEAERGPDSLLLPDSLNTLAGIARARERLGEAEQLYQRALDISAQRLGESHPSTAIYMGNLAAVLDDRGQVERALALQRRVLAIREEALGAEHPRVAEALVNFSLMAAETGAFDDAAAAAGRALRISEKAFGPDAPPTNRARVALAGALLALGHLDEARDASALAIEGLESSPGARSGAELLTALQIAGDVAVAGGRFPDAVALYQRALEQASTRLGPDSAAAGRALRGLSNAWRKSGAPAQALAAAERALPRLAAHAENDIPIGLGLLALGEARLALGDARTAQPPLDRAHAILERVPGLRVEAAEAASALAAANHRR